MTAPHPINTLQGGRGITAAESRGGGWGGHMDAGPLQGGRGITAAERPTLRRTIREREDASMRPRHYCRGKDVCVSADTLADIALQGGRGITAAERTLVIDGTSHQSVLQGGRGITAAESIEQARKMREMAELQGGRGITAAESLNCSSGRKSGSRRFNEAAALLPRKVCRRKRQQR